MSLEVMRRRRKAVIRQRGNDTIDEYGNEVPGYEDSAPYWVLRQQLSSAEDTVNRDQLSETYRYVFQPSASISGRDLIVDEGRELEVIGEPEPVFGRFGIHHIEVVARYMEG